MNDSAAVHQGSTVVCPCRRSCGPRPRRVERGAASTRQADGSAMAHQAVSLQGLQAEVGAGCLAHWPSRATSSLSSACHFRRASGSHEKRWACVGLPCSWIPWKGCAQSSCRHPCPRATMCKTSARLQRQKVGTHSQPLPARLRRQTAQQVASGQSWAQKQDCSAGAIPCGTAPRTRRQGRPRAVQGCVKGSCQGTEAAKHARGACGVLRVRLPRHTNQQP